MPFLALALLQAAATSPPPPAALPYTISTTPDGAFRLIVARLAADQLDTVRTMLDDAATAKCGTKAVAPGEEGYNQATDADGNPAPVITDLSETFRCA